MKQIKVLSLFFSLALVSFLLIGAQGCATKGFVEQKVRPLETKITDLSSQVEELKAEDTHIREELARLDKKGIVKKLLATHSIMFGFDKWQLPEQAKDTLDQIAQELIAKENLAVFVVGHTDNVGPEAYNLELGQRRAQMVAAYLLGKPEILPYRVYVESLGEFLPESSNETYEGRSINRQAEILLVETNLQ